MKMCGINGIINFTELNEDNVKIVEAMNDSIAHRGPDGEGVFISKNKKVIFGNKRLSIVDIESGAQPVILEYNGFEYVITLNGQIYNHKNIRKQLEEKGHIFKTNSDTEVLLKAYIEWGKDCLDQVNGQFAFAIYDGAKNKIFLARDRVGIKPFYYSFLLDGSLIFSSEPKGILSHPDFKKEPDKETIADFFLGVITFTNWCAPLNKSFFKNLYALEPGTYAFFDKHGLKISKYWDIPIPEKKLGSESIEILGEKLRNSIIMRIPDEVKVGTALSGGLDSSIVTSITVNNFDNELTSATIKFEESNNNPDFDHAQILAKEKKINLIASPLTAKEMIADIDLMIKAMDEPHDTIRQLGLFAIYRNLSKAECKVVLVGEGADEFNLGYYYNSPGFHKDRGICDSPERFREILKRKSLHVSKFFTTEFLDSINFKEIINKGFLHYFTNSPSNNPLDMMQYLYSKRFLQYRLQANDRCSMAHSVEARVPFCDHNVVEVSLAISPELNLKDGTEKYALRQAFRHELPQEIFERRKYPLPESKNLELYKLILNLLKENIVAADPNVWCILNKRYVVELTELFKKEITNIKNGADNKLTEEISLNQDVEIRIKHIFSVLTFLRWFEIYFVDKKKNISEIGLSC